MGFFYFTPECGVLDNQTSSSKYYMIFKEIFPPKSVASLVFFDGESGHCAEWGESYNDLSHERPIFSLHIRIDNKEWQRHY
jgi:hypothetical protein